VNDFDPLKCVLTIDPDVTRLHCYKCSKIRTILRVRIGRKVVNMCKECNSILGEPMRHLNKRQIDILKGYPKAFSIEDLPNEVWQRIEELNEYETLWQDVNRFLGDQYFGGK